MLTPSSNTPRKAKICLNDYPFERDVKVRLFMAELKSNEIKVLLEIIHHSLKISIDELADELDLELSILNPILDKLSTTKLFTRQHKILIVDKEMRKYLETEIEKFNDDFRPDIDFIQNLLSKVPIHILLTWYAIPRTSDNIFDSIVEKYLLTPKIYKQYLTELQFDNPILTSIIQEVFQPPHYTVSTEELRIKFNLTHESLEEYLLLLEYHLICCVNYRKIEGEWKEIVTPFAEWWDFLQFDYRARPQPLPKESIKTDFNVEFSFIKDVATLLQSCQEKKCDHKNIKEIDIKTPTQLERIINKSLQLKLVTKAGADQIMITNKGKDWLTKPLFEQIAMMGNDPQNELTMHDEFASLWNMRNLRLIEKNLRRLPSNIWISFENYLQGLIAPIGNNQPVILKNKGKKWQYVLPSYTDQEKKFIQAVIMERLAELGMIETGSYQDKPCFRLTPFGHHIVH